MAVIGVLIAMLLIVVLMLAAYSFGAQTEKFRSADKYEISKELVNALVAHTNHLPTHLEEELLELQSSMNKTK